MYQPGDPRYGPYQQGRQQGFHEAGSQFGAELRQTVDELRRDFEGRLNGLAGAMRQQLGRGSGKELDRRLEQADQKLTDIATIAQHLQAERGGGGGGPMFSQRDEGCPAYRDSAGRMIRVEDIPGRRVPFTMLVQIPIGPDTREVQEDSFMVPTEGPFIAVKRMATFLSQYEFQVEDADTGTTPTFPGRTFGRFRPISSALDVLDSQHASIGDLTRWFLHANDNGAAGDPLPCGSLAMASSASSFRSMLFDGTIEVVVEGASYPRQKIAVPTAFWTTSLQAPFDLAALDFFERHETVTFKVQPTHLNNPEAGNVDGEAVFPAAAAAGTIGYPFLAGQYDPHEGIATPDCVELGTNGSNDFVPASTDPITRLPSGIFIVGYEGYRIVQPVGPAL